MVRVGIFMYFDIVMVKECRSVIPSRSIIQCNINGICMYQVDIISMLFTLISYGIDLIRSLLTVNLREHSAVNEEQKK